MQTKDYLSVKTRDDPLVQTKDHTLMQTRNHTPVQTRDHSSVQTTDHPPVQIRDHPRPTPPRKWTWFHVKITLLKFGLARIIWNHLTHIIVFLLSIFQFFNKLITFCSFSSVHKLLHFSTILCNEFIIKNWEK